MSFPEESQPLIDSSLSLLDLFLGSNTFCFGAAAAEESEDDGEERGERPTVPSPVGRKRLPGNRSGDVAIREAISSRQRRQHRLWLERIRHCRSWRSVIDLLENSRKTVPWRWSTTKTKLGTILGAVPRAVYYGVPCRLGAQGAEVRDYQHRVTMGVIDELDTIKQAVPLALEQFKRIARRQLMRGDVEAAVYTMILWALTSRPKCGLALRTRLVGVDDPEFRAKFIEGKGVTMRQRPYTIQSQLGPDMCLVMKRWLQDRAAKNERYVFSQTPKHQRALRKRVLEDVRRIDPLMELYSFRRGSALTMHRGGASVSAVREFTGHSNDAMTERYLEYGWWNVAQRELNRPWSSLLV